MQLFTDDLVIHAPTRAPKTFLEAPGLRVAGTAVMAAAKAVRKVMRATHRGRAPRCLHEMSCTHALFDALRKQSLTRCMTRSMIRYLVGDATEPEGNGRIIIAHIVNDAKGWGRGFVLALSRRWEQPETFYRQWARDGFDEVSGKFTLGNVQFVPVDGHRVVVANMVAQHGYGSSAGPPIRYDSLRTCLMKVAAEATETGASVHMPRIGTGLAGGSWNKIEPIIASTCERLNVFVYDLPRKA